MSRMFRNCEDYIKEIDRELFQSGIKIEINHYQNKKLEGEDRFTKEIIGVDVCISKPLQKRFEMLQHIFGPKAEQIEQYCIQEFKDRISPIPLNPGNSYKIRQDLWQKFMVDNDTKFDYTYSERLCDKWSLAIAALKEDKHSINNIHNFLNINNNLENKTNLKEGEFNHVESHIELNIGMIACK